jgi:hypothetical protein
LLDSWHSQGPDTARTWTLACCQLGGVQLRIWRVGLLRGGRARVVRRGDACGDCWQLLVIPWPFWTRFCGVAKQSRYTRVEFRCALLLLFIPPKAGRLRDINQAGSSASAVGLESFGMAGTPSKKPNLVIVQDLTIKRHLYHVRGLPCPSACARRQWQIEQ